MILVEKNVWSFLVEKMGSPNPNIGGTVPRVPHQTVTRGLGEFYTIIIIKHKRSALKYVTVTLSPTSQNWHQDKVTDIIPSLT